ncbi:MAG: hypothetical protein WD894_22930 [Pirellulales bacterium]
MTRVTLDAQLRSKLGDLHQPLELCDESGRILARVFPHYDPADYENLEPEINEDELKRLRQYKGKTYTTEEVIAHLEQL